MKYKKTYDLVDQLISQHVDEIEIKKYKYNSDLLLPYRQKECTGLFYQSKISDLRISVEFNELFLKISLFTLSGSLSRIVYKKDDGLIFDPEKSRGCAKLARVNKKYLIPEIEKG